MTIKKQPPKTPKPKQQDLDKADKSIFNALVKKASQPLPKTKALPE